MISTSGLAAILAALGTITPAELDAAREGDFYSTAFGAANARTPLGTLHAADVFLGADDKTRDLIARLASERAGERPVAWRGHHMHPQARDTWTYVDGADKPEVRVGGLTDLQPLHL